MKTCARCHVAKPPEAFHKGKSRKDGLYPYCKPCRAHGRGLRGRQKVSLQLNEVDTAWVAGILEGEACFHLQKRPDRVKHNPLIRFSSTDLDVIEKIARLIGAGRVRPCPKTPTARKPAWVWDLNQMGMVELLLQAIRPHMSSRRTEKIDLILAEIKTRWL